MMKGEPKFGGSKKKSPDLDGIEELQRLLMSAQQIIGMGVTSKEKSIHRLANMTINWMEERIEELDKAKQDWIPFNRKIWKRGYERIYARKTRSKGVKNTQKVENAIPKQP